MSAYAALSGSAQEAAPALQITGAVKQPLTLTAADLATMPRASVRFTIHGTEALCAKDGYNVVFSLGEIDPALTDNQILVADKADKVHSV